LPAGRLRLPPTGRTNNDYGPGGAGRYLRADLPWDGRSGWNASHGRATAVNYVGVSHHSVLVTVVLDAGVTVEGLRVSFDSPHLFVLPPFRMPSVWAFRNTGTGVDWTSPTTPPHLSTLQPLPHYTPNRTYRPTGGVDDGPDDTPVWCRTLRMPVEISY